jgi:hypothetical protein
MMASLIPARVSVALAHYSVLKSGSFRGKLGIVS